MKNLILAALILALAIPCFADEAYEKVDDNTMKVIRTNVIMADIVYEDIIAQRDGLLVAIDNLAIQQANETTELQAALVILEKRITEADKFGIVEKPEPIEEVIE